MKKIIILLIFACFGSVIIAQKSQGVKINVAATHAQFLGKTMQVRDLQAIPDSDPFLRKQKFQRNRQTPDNFIGRNQGSKSILAELEHQGPDILRQEANPAGFVVEPKVNINGIGNFGSPHDPTGDVGLDYFVQAINVTYVGVFSKEGELIQSFAMSQLWAGMGVFSAGDPIVLYDDIENRWFITEFTGPSNLLIAVSETSDPLGSYYAYSFSTPRFPDYPKYAIWGDKLVVTTNEQGGGRLHQYFLDKQALVSGADNVDMQRVEVVGSYGTEAGFFVATPVDADGKLFPEDDRPITMKLNDSSWGVSAQDQLEMYRFNINFNDPDSTIVENIIIPTSPYDSYPCSALTGGFACIPQPFGGGLDGVPETIMNIPKYRNFGTHESIVLCFVTDVTDGDNLSGIRWVELRKQTGSEWSMFQEGTYGPDDDLHRFMPSVAIDGKGNIGLGYNVSNEETYVGIRYTGRMVNDPPGIMSVKEYNVVNGLNTINSGGRFGDYAQMSVDPVDESTFWFTTEYAGNATNVTQTRIVAFELRKDSSDLAVAQLISPKTSSLLDTSERVVVEIQNSGLKAMKDFTIAYEFDGSMEENVLIEEELLPDSVLIYSFSTPLNLSAKKAYPFNISVNHPNDQRSSNDTLLQQVYNIYQKDASIELLMGETNCRSILESVVYMQNMGEDTIDSALFYVSINGLVTDSITWQGGLDFMENVEIPFDIHLVDVGLNEIAVLLYSINGLPDQMPANNIAYFDIDYSSSNETIVLKLTTDEFPEETTWQIKDSDQNVVLSGGPYDQEKTTITEYLCVDSNDCFTFTIKDSAGDGICCGSGIGRYVMELESGDVLFQSFGSFGFEKSQQFCGSGYECDLSVDIELIEDSGLGDGSILIDVSNGIEPYVYSIDGGDNFQDSPVFENLIHGEYDVLVEDNSGMCSYSESIALTLSTNTSSISQENDQKIIIKPNPNDGYFEFEYYDPEIQDKFIVIEIINGDGRIVQSIRAGKFDEVFRGSISLIDYPSGNYYLRFISHFDAAIFKVVKL